MVLPPSYSRTQDPGESSSDCQSRIPLLANTKNPYPHQQQGVEDRFEYDANRSQEDDRRRSLNDDGCSTRPRLWPTSFSHYRSDIYKSNADTPGDTETEVQLFRPTPGVSLKARPPKTVLERGLQIPTRISYITSGFRLPRALCDAGVDRARWAAFTREITAYGSLSKSQWAILLGCSCAVGLLIDCFLPPFGLLGFVPIFAHKKRRDKERENFGTALVSGGLQLVTEKWNRTLFEPLGVQVLIEPPNCFGASNMATMDVASTKLFRYQEKKGLYSPTIGGLSECADEKEVRYARKEGKYRTKAARKGRIIIRPIQTEPTQAEVDVSAVVSSNDCLDGNCKSQARKGQDSSGHGAGYVSTSGRTFKSVSNSRCMQLGHEASHSCAWCGRGGV